MLNYDSSFPLFKVPVPAVKRFANPLQVFDIFVNLAKYRQTLKNEKIVAVLSLCLLQIKLRAKSG